MVMLNYLRSGCIARIVKIENNQVLKDKLKSKGIIEGSIIRVISCFGPIIFEVDKRIFSIGNKIAEKIRVIEIM